MSSSIKPLVLHAHSTGPNPFKIAIALELLGVPYEVRLWQFGDASNGVKGTDFTKINPNGRVPAVEDPNTGVVSWESGAIMEYLLRVYDKQNKLGPREGTEQARVDYDKWIFFLVSTLGPFQGQTNWFKHYNSTKNQDALERYEQQSLRCFGVVEGQLKSHGGSYILPGQTVSAVDLHMHPWISSHGFAGLSLDNYPSLKKWVGTVGDLKEVKAGYEKVSKGQQM